MGKLDDNVYRETKGKVLLICGHFSTGAPIAILPSKRKMFICSQGCGLKKAKR